MARGAGPKQPQGKGRGAESTALALIAPNPSRLARLGSLRIPLALTLRARELNSEAEKRAWRECVLASCAQLRSLEGVGFSGLLQRPDGQTGERTSGVGMGAYCCLSRPPARLTALGCILCKSSMAARTSQTDTRMTSIHETPISRAKAQDPNTSSPVFRTNRNSCAILCHPCQCDTHNPTDSARLGTPIHPEIVRTDHTPTRPLGHSATRVCPQQYPTRCLPLCPLPCFTTPTTANEERTDIGPKAVYMW